MQGHKLLLYKVIKNNHLITVSYGVITDGVGFPKVVTHVELSVVFVNFVELNLDMVVE